MSDKVKVTIQISERITWESTVEMTREKFEELDKLQWRYDEYKEKIAMYVNRSDSNFVNANDLEIEDMYLVEDEPAKFERVE